MALKTRGISSKETKTRRKSRGNFFVDLNFRNCELKKSREKAQARGNVLSEIMTTISERLRVKLHEKHLIL